MTLGVDDNLEVLMVDTSVTPAVANRSQTASSEVQHRVAISHPFYAGIFEITQQQYYNVTGQKPALNQGDSWQYRPVENVSYKTVRSGNWPTSAAPGANSFMDKLLAKCKAKDGDGNYTVAVTGFDLRNGQRLPE